jgi:hypothetical protein
VLAGLRLEPNITVATPKVSLLGGWLSLPRWASHPLDFTVLPGRSRIAGLTPIGFHVIAKANSFGVDGALDASPASLGALPDMDFQLLDDQDNVLSSSGNLGPKEFVSAAITPGRTYRYRVVGYVSGPTQFVITSKQYFPSGMAPESGGSGGSSSFLPSVQGARTLKLARFTVNPLTKSVTLKLLN